ncbi:MAG: helix-turn-helix transcriptional regulator [Xanthobacteraceae bacterium]
MAKLPSSAKGEFMAQRSSTAADREIGRRLKIRRLDLGISQTAVADALGLTFQQVQKYEKGTNRISAGRLQRLAEILDIPIAYFYDEKIAGTKKHQTAFALLDTAYSLRLMRAFTRIKDRRIQLRTVELVEGIADADHNQAH